MSVLHVEITAGEESMDWWSKFYASIGDKNKCGTYLERGFDTLKESSLSCVAHALFDLYPDSLGPNSDLPLHQDLKHMSFCSSAAQTSDLSNQNVGMFKIYPLPDDPSAPAPRRQFRKLPPNGIEDCLVRVYIIKAQGLQPKDANGKVGLNSPNQEADSSTTKFKMMFELTCSLPLEKDLRVMLYDHDMLTKDEKIGETLIDLENRFLSKYGATCGLSQSYCV
ncbi:hypothetical protein GOODEAATRI_007110 [Goodea atripinnis]|uniref:C2 domain-containing protein n=1 Tax=Goodea atripinnis TaxID=208336 RepID=A0ABV0MGT0_9TELE